VVDVHILFIGKMLKAGGQFEKAGDIAVFFRIFDLH